MQLNTGNNVSQIATVRRYELYGWNSFLLCNWNSGSVKSPCTLFAELQCNQTVFAILIIWINHVVPSCSFVLAQSVKEPWLFLHWAKITEKGFEGRTEIFLEWYGIDYLLPVPFDNPFRCKRLLQICHECDVRKMILSVWDDSLLLCGVALKESCLFLPCCISKKEVAVIWGNRDHNLLRCCADGFWPWMDGYLDSFE